MKPKIDKISIISLLIILFLISIPGFYAYYFTDWKNDRFSQDIAKRQVIPEFQEDSRIFDNRIVLRKDKSITVNKNRLVFKGLKDKMIHLDVYLLELDPEYAYPHYISKADAYKGIQLGDSTFQLLKIRKGVLQLKIVDLYES
ncbi:hypothetical protein [Desulfobacula sp.]|uniref:hypothetical protein n=1 Tax=Desulfobacula sp. TaxID=2593537 RepID=UPI0026241640|nr:hypothetical protein [Desulfobacula sp.]